jgi:hypothetical protein
MNAANKKDGFFAKGRYTQFLPIVLPIALAIVVYINALPNGFVFDDMTTIVHNVHIKDLAKNFPAFFNLDYFKIAQAEVSYRPIATLSYFLIYALFNLNPLAFHLTSLLLHIFNVIGVYVLADIIRHNKRSSLIAALVFACHPVLTETVNCISYNEDLLATFFYLLALVLYIKAGAKENRSDLPIYVFSFISFLAALLSKEMAITLPVIIFLRHCYPKKWRSLCRSLFSFMTSPKKKRPKQMVSSNRLSLPLTNKNFITSALAWLRYFIWC